MNRQDREAQARSYYEQSMVRVKQTQHPSGQKYPPGTRVKIVDILPRSMAHFVAGKLATVEYTYAHAYGGDNVRAYSLNIDGVGSVAWYDESQIEPAPSNAALSGSRPKE